MRSAPSAREVPAPDRLPDNGSYWLFRHFREEVELEIIDTEQWRYASYEPRVLHFYLTQGVRAASAARRFDAVVAHGAQSAVVLLGLRRAFKGSWPLTMVVDVGALNGGRPQQRLQFQLTRMALGQADRIVWHASASRELARTACPELLPKAAVIPFGIDVDALDSMPTHDGGYALCCGYANRDWRTLHESWKHVSGARLFVAGVPGLRGPAERPDGVTLLPRLPHDEYLRLVAGCRMVILPLPDGYASWGQTTLLEAMGLSKPVIVSDVRTDSRLHPPGLHHREPGRPHGAGARGPAALAQ